MAVLYSSFFIFVSLLSFALFGMREEKMAHIQKRIQAYFSQPAAAEAGGMEEDDRSFFERVIGPTLDSFKIKYNKRLGKEEAAKIETLLMQAGQPFGLSPVEFKLVQSGLLLGLPLFALLIGWLAGLGFFTISMAVIIGVVLATMLPKMYLKKTIKKRSELAGRELPDILDLLTISLEAGLGFDAALSQVVSKKKGEVVKEFKVSLEEMRLGSTRKEALSAINDRLASDDLRSLIFNIIQAEKLGIGMVSVLRVQTEDIRERRRQRAEEAAMKAPIKMMFPLVMFIFPTLFIILLGPAVLQFMDAF
ncbi:type II secretion system F family protein [Virgibacillus xinjiangensis]|uniref:Type II secretion system F family protein n=1 Tax=Virgibacillus xinjiangensis TaxID=393090 RepID=A0ABV7CZF0_9BACI